MVCVLAILQPHSQWLWIAIATSCYLICLLAGALFIGQNFYFQSVNRFKTNEKIAAITFDDGPTPHTLPLLEVLQKHNVKATFFCIGKQVELFPEIVRKIEADGHLIGNHSFSHTFAFTFSPMEKVQQELMQTNAAIERATGNSYMFFRPPFGVTNPKIGKALKNMRMRSIGWNRRSLDTRTANQATILRRTAHKLQPGDIVLFHDHIPAVSGTVDAFLRIAKEKGFAFDRIDNLLKINEV